MNEWALFRRGCAAKQGGSTGFSLVEVVIAMGILAVGILGLLVFLTKINTTRQESERMATATTLASSIMDGYLARTASVPSAGYVFVGTYGTDPNFPAYKPYVVVSAANAEGMRLLRVGVVWLRDRGAESTISGLEITAANVATERSVVELQALVPN